MAINDPVGRYAHPHPQRADAPQAARSPRPARSCARACSTCCRPKAISAAIPQTEYGNGRTEFEIELKYYDGPPVIREIAARLEARPPRLCVRRRPCRASPTASASRSSRRRRA